MLQRCQALAAALPRPADSDVSGDMVGVLVHLVDKSSQRLGFKWIRLHFQLQVLPLFEFESI
jgi:hypothetical protein